MITTDRAAVNGLPNGPLRPLESGSLLPARAGHVGTAPVVDGSGWLMLGIRPKQNNGPKGGQRFIAE
jgi:hypothetical protein